MKLNIYTLIVKDMGRTMLKIASFEVQNTRIRSIVLALSHVALGDSANQYRYFQIAYAMLPVSYTHLTLPTIYSV